MPDFLTDLGWIDSDRVQAFSAVITALVTIFLFRLTTNQLRHSDLASKEKWKPVVGFALNWRGGSIARISLVNFGPGVALNIHVECDIKSEGIKMYDNRGLSVASLSPEQSAFIEIIVTQTDLYVDAVLDKLDQVPLAHIHARYQDAIGRRYESIANLIYERDRPAHLSVQLMAISVGQDFKQD